MKPASEVLFLPKALRDLERLDDKYARQILADVELLRSSPWPPGKIKKLRGIDLWEVKTGDYRALFVLQASNAVVARVVDRKELERAIKRVDVQFVLRWLRQQET